MKRVFTVKQAAVITGFSKELIKQRFADGEFPNSYRRSSSKSAAILIPGKDLYDMITKLQNVKRPTRRKTTHRRAL